MCLGSLLSCNPVVLIKLPSFSQLEVSIPSGT